MKKLLKISNDQRGMASIVVVSVVVSILAIITLSFTKIMNNELRQSLDRELSTQATYAAESGLNDARRYSLGLAAGDLNVTGNNCEPPNNSPYFPAEGDYSGTGAVSGPARYSCIVVETAPKELVFQLEAGETKVFKVSLPNPRLVRNIYFGWENSNGTHVPIAGYPTLPTDSSKPADATGVIRLGLYPVPAGLVDNAALSAVSRNYVLHSNSGGAVPGTVSYAVNGATVRGNCDASEPKPLSGAPYNYNSIGRYCNSAITGINQRVMFVRMTAVYGPMTVSVMAVDDLNNVIEIPDIQSVVDITGAGSDVLKRIRARVPLQNQYEVPVYGVVSTMGVCKLFRTPVIGAGFYSNPTLDPYASGDARCPVPGGSGPVAPGLPPTNLNAPVITFNPGSNFSINSGQSQGFSWTTVNAGGGCESSGTWGDTQSFTIGAFNTGPLGDGTYTYTLTCLSSLGVVASASVVVNVTTPAPDCNDHGHSLSGDWSNWRADVTGNNPCGVGIVQCVVVDFFTTETHAYGNINPAIDGSSMVGSVACQDIMGHCF